MFKNKLFSIALTGLLAIVQAPAQAKGLSPACQTLYGTASMMIQIVPPTHRQEAKKILNEVEKNKSLLTSEPENNQEVICRFVMKVIAANSNIKLNIGQ